MIKRNLPLIASVALLFSAYWLVCAALASAPHQPYFNGLGDTVEILP